VGLHPAERVREYRDKGYWTDDMIDALLRERVAQFGDITAITDPLNREALLDGPFRTLTWPQLDEQVSRLAQVLLAEGAVPRLGAHPPVQRGAGQGVHHGEPDRAAARGG
jgi:non-ribosomal peptide synthetase component E (peptide arylation enzyme)